MNQSRAVKTCTELHDKFDRSMPRSSLRGAVQLNHQTNRQEREHLSRVRHRTDESIEQWSSVREARCLRSGKMRNHRLATDQKCAIEWSRQHSLARIGFRRRARPERRLVDAYVWSNAVYLIHSVKSQISYCFLFLRDQFAFVGKDGMEVFFQVTQWSCPDQVFTLHSADLFRVCWLGRPNLNL